VPVELFFDCSGEAFALGFAPRAGSTRQRIRRAKATAPRKHLDDTIYGGDFLANQPIVKRMCDAAPGIIDLLDRMGVTF